MLSNEMKQFADSAVGELLSPIRTNLASVHRHLADQAESLVTLTSAISLGENKSTEMSKRMNKFEGSLQDSINVQKHAGSAHDDKLDSVLNSPKALTTLVAGLSKEATPPSPGQPGDPPPHDPPQDEDRGSSKKARLEGALNTP